MKLCRIIPANMRPVYHILPNNRLISVPTEMPLTPSQVVRATAQATVYEVVNGGEVLLTPQNKFSDNTNAPISTTVHEIKEYYNEKGEKIAKPVKEATVAQADEVTETPAPVEETKADEQAEAAKEESEPVTDAVPTEDKVDSVDDANSVKEAPVAQADEVTETAAPVEETKADSEDEAKEAQVAQAKEEAAKPVQQNNNSKKNGKNNRRN